VTPPPPAAAPNHRRSTTRAAKLLARIRARYDVITEPLTIGPVRVEFTRVVDADKVLDDVAAAIDRRERLTGVREDDVQHLPYWAELWDSAFGVSQRLVDRSVDWGLGGGPRVLDLGCGMGLTGLVAATLGAGRVVLADLEPPSLLFASYNCRRFADRCHPRRVNWQTDDLGERFDLILGADILYDRTQWPFLERFWRNHLGACGAVLLGEPGRQTGDAFVEWIAARGWRLVRVDVPVTGRTRPIRIFELARD